MVQESDVEWWADSESSESDYSTDSDLAEVMTNQVKLWLSNDQTTGMPYVLLVWTARQTD